MTEAEWLATDDVLKMLRHVAKDAPDRKSRLYVVAGCRSISHLLYDERSHVAVEVAEQFADGSAGEGDLVHADYHAEVPTFGYDFNPSDWRQWAEPGKLPENIQKLLEMGVYTAANVEEEVSRLDHPVARKLMAAAELAYQCASGNPLWSQLQECVVVERWISQVDWPGPWLVRDIFGNPFRPDAIDPAWLAWNNGTVVKLAKTIYEDRRWELMPILGDALEDAMCDNTDMLEHSRGPGPHVRGCWVVDLILGKE